MTDLADPLWLALMVDDSLASFPARERRGEVASAGPPGDPLSAFEAPIREDIDVLLRSPAAAAHREDGAWLRALVASLLAARAGESAIAVAADPARPHRRSMAAVRRALEVTAGVMVEHGWPPADPRGGLPLRSGLLAIDRAHLERLARDHAAGRFDLVRVRRRLAQARAEKALLFTTLASWLVSSGAPSTDSSRTLLMQLRQLELQRAAHQRVRAALTSPLAPAQVASRAPPHTRQLLVRELLVAEVACGATSANQVAFIAEFASACGTTADEIPALRTAAAARCASCQRWLEPRAATDAESLAREWALAGERMYSRVADAFAYNLGALVTEVRETGELGQLLGRAAAGQPLTREERAKVKAQLIDLAKVVPALAIFAAPGGLILLPLLTKLLPFSVLPSAWHQPTPAPAKLPAPAQKTGSD